MEGIVKVKARRKGRRTATSKRNMYKTAATITCS
jgi:hypothetical protein